MTSTLVTKAVAQLKREVLEYRWGLIYIPTLLSALLIIVASSFSYYWLYIRQHDMRSDFTVNGAAIELMYINCALVTFFYFFILANYLSSCLYDDRKSKQILFWRSMPVSETMNVLTKLLVVVLVAPGLLLIFNAVISLAGLIIGYIFTSGLNPEAPILFSKANEGSVFVVILEVYRDNLFGMLFLAPFIGYLLVVSAWVKRFPLAIAFGVPMLLVFIDFLLSRVDLTIGLISLLTLYGSFWIEIKGTFILKEIFTFEMKNLLPLLTSLLIGGVLVSISIWLRNNRHEI